jgi:2-polyprenyl-3-methyl-5-hydroxy-6-metoxy-1,4-benzoquinol methylase
MRKYSRSYFVFHKISAFRLKQINDMADLVKSFRTEGKLFEIGCGDGNLLSLLSRTFDVKAIDISSDAVQMANKRLAENRVSVMDIEKSELEGQFDVILALNVLEHLQRPDTAILKIRNSLRKDGIFIFSVPNNYSLGKVTTFFMGLFDRTHISTFERKKWVDLIRESGFKPLQILNGVIYRPFRWEFAKHFASTMVMIAEKSEEQVLNKTEN